MTSTPSTTPAVAVRAAHADAVLGVGHLDAGLRQHPADRVEQLEPGAGQPTSPPVIAAAIM